jgi:hypothetical protein
MGSDLSIQAASTLATMQVERTGQELGIKMMKMRLQQDDKLVALLMEQAKQIQDGGYNGSGGAVAPAGSANVDVTM